VSRDKNARKCWWRCFRIASNGGSQGKTKEEPIYCSDRRKRRVLSLRRPMRMPPMTIGWSGWPQRCKLQTSGGSRRRAEVRGRTGPVLVAQVPGTKGAPVMMTMDAGGGPGGTMKNADERHQHESPLGPSDRYAGQKTVVDGDRNRRELWTWLSTYPWKNMAGYEGK